MTSKVRASIELRGSRLRYAEVAEHGETFELLNAGEVPLEFDIEEEVFSNQVFLHREALRQILTQAFPDSSSPYLYVVLPPYHGMYFFSPQDSRWTRTEREESLLRDLGLLAGEDALGLLHVSVGTTQPVRESYLGPVWYHVLAVPQQGFLRIEQATEDLVFARCQLFSSVQGAVMLGRRRIMQLPHGGEDAWYLLIGQYKGQTELALGRGEAWVFAHDEPVDHPSDIVYYALKVLERNRVNPRSLTQIWLYGEQVREEGLQPLTHITGCIPERLDPFAVVAAQEVKRKDFSAFVPCIGAAL